MKNEPWYIEGKRLGLIQEATLTLEDTRAIEVGLMNATWLGDRWWLVTNALHVRVHHIYKMLVSPFRTRGTRVEVLAKLTRQSAEWQKRLGPRDNILPPEAITSKGVENRERGERRRAIASANSNKTRVGRSREGAFDE